MGGFDLGVAGFIVAGAVSVTALQGIYHIPFIVAMAAAAVGLGGCSGRSPATSATATGYSR